MQEKINWGTKTMLNLDNQFSVNRDIFYWNGCNFGSFKLELSDADGFFVVLTLTNEPGDIELMSGFAHSFDAYVKLSI